MAKVELDIRAQIKDLNKGLKSTQTQLKDLQTKSKQTSKEMQSNMNQTSKVAGDLKASLAGVFAVGTAVSLAKSIITVRAEFEKFEAMLKVALGSAEAANREFDKIKQFAATTPFSVRELTDSFVRLVNQGFKPTQKEMKAMGDLAAAMGKDFIQLTEAIIDAQVGEFERLKEFGIRASKEGDNVTLAFKGVEHQVDFTAEAIQQAIIGFGEMEGVMGTMEEVSQTLGGQLSMLGDSVTLLANEIGKMSGEDVGNGITVIKNLADILKGLAELRENENGALAILKQINLRIAQFAPALRPIQSLKLGLESLGILTGEVAELFNEENEDSVASVVDRFNRIINDTNKNTAEEAETISTLQAKLKGLQEDLKNTNIEDEAAIAVINQKTAAIKAQIDALTKLGEALKVTEIKEKKEPDIDKQLAKEQQNFILGIAKETAEKMKVIDGEIAESRKGEIDQSLGLQLAAEQAKREAFSTTFDILKTLASENAAAYQVVAISEAIINGALAQIKVATAIPYPTSIPFQIALGLQTLAQIATMRQQKFERGGYDVLRGRRHAQGGIDVGIGEAEEGEGVAVFSRQATQKYGKFIPAFVKAINENKTDVTDQASYSFNYDDSRSVGKLEAIRELLSKPEVRYEGGYRIETRGGQRTRVKI